MKRIFDQRLFLFATKMAQIFLSRLKLYEEVRASTAFFRDMHIGEGPFTVIEVGTQRGSNARSICNNIDVKTIYCVDPYGGYTELRQGKEYEYNSSRFLKVAKSRLRKYPAKFIIKESREAADYTPNNIDFIYIDGNHDYAYCLDDIERYYAKLRPGGVLAGHDFCGNFREVIEAVYVFLSKNPGLVLHTKEADWWFVKE